MKSWEDLTATNVSRDPSTIDFELHTGSVTIRTFKPVTDAVLRSRRFYIKIEQACDLRDPSYGRFCGKVVMRSYRILKGRQSYVDGQPVGPGDVIGAYR